MHENSDVTTYPRPSDALLTVVADGVVAAHLRRRIEGDTQTGVDAIPLVYNYLDYLLLTAADGADLVLAVDDTRPFAISTDTGGPATSSQRSATGIALNNAAKLDLAALGPGSSRTYENATRLGTLIGQMADARGSEVSEQLYRRMASGVHALVQHLQANPERPVEPSAPEDPDWLKALLRDIGKGFGSVVDSMDDRQSLYLRYWGDQGWEFWNLQGHGDGDLDPTVIQQVTRTLRTGFARKTIGDRAVTVTIPGHFGSVPWLVVCKQQELTGDRSAVWQKGLWWAFTAYRDNSILNTSLRMAARGIAIQALRKLIRDSVEAGGSEADWMKRLQSRWQDLMRVYPFPELSITPCESESKTSEPALTIGSRRFRLLLTARPNQHFSWPSLPDRDGGSESWGPIDQKTLDNEVIAPEEATIASNRLAKEREQLERGQAIARAAYNVGHPLGHRIKGARWAVEEALDEGVERLHRAAALDRPEERGKAIASSLDILTKALRIGTDSVHEIRRTSRLMHFMANIMRHDVTDLRDRFYSFSPFALGAYVRQTIDQLNELAVYDEKLQPLAVNADDLQRCSHAYVPPHIHTPCGLARFFDCFYQEPLYECLRNAAVHGARPSTQISLSVDAGDRTKHELPVTITNDCATQPLSGHDDRWIEWGSIASHEGGLRFIADCLKHAGAGRVSVRQQRLEGIW